MDRIGQIESLLLAQDLVRIVYVNQGIGILSNLLRKIDKEMSKTINVLGGTLDENDYEKIRLASLGLASQETTSQIKSKDKVIIS